ncbi:hypothetical protein GF339_05535 [candidate division KSB3 bacterium]|uniref:Polysaccharide pyruvyl transferase domain-containing protein n=1 Tax=candidate division KSB3 bacterium TaxID=2044937 RepID=A0A9D5JTX4_9BACT|nr:hypothetical protein [candidate division KSB3 bacterium]MBD3324025.1 hypothetical protein [candidate division KSB3 bacterium]
MRIGLITTLSTNIGDDFIREGICAVLQEVFRGQDLEFFPVNKHQPLTVYPQWHPIHLAQYTGYLPRGKFRLRQFIERVAPKLKQSHFDSCEVIVQCGAPVLWHGCYRCEWAEPLWHEVIGRVCHRIPVLNLAAGACYPWTRQPTQLTDEQDRAYIQKLLAYCRVTTVRDELAQRLCKALGPEPFLIPCSAFLAAKKQTASMPDSGVVLINYMAGAGHFEWNQGIDASAWFRTVKTLIHHLSRRHKVAFLCHSEAEFQLAQELDFPLPRLWPKTPQEYFNVVSSAKAALCNRLHASVGLAGMGIPSISVCTDTRLLMVKELGLPYHFVQDVESEVLEHELEHLLTSRFREQERLLSLQDETWNRYIEVLTEVLL